MSEYGTVEVDVDYNHDKPVVTVIRADPIIGIDAAMLSDRKYVLDCRINEDGYMVIGDINPITLKPIKFADRGHVIVCERVDSTEDADLCGNELQAPGELGHCQLSAGHPPPCRPVPPTHDKPMLGFPT